jgi:N-acetylneuraminic acid mutarotase
MLLSATSALAAGVLSARINWHDLPPMPAGVAGGAVGLLEGGRLVYAGGTAWVDGVKQWLADVQEYDLATKSWRRGPNLPEPLAYGASTASSRELEILGGMKSDGPSRNCWRLSSSRTGWVRTGELPQDAILARAELVSGALYLFGGCSNVVAPMHCSSAVWKREGVGKWTRAGDMPDGAVAMRASATLDGYVYLFGGCSEIAGGVANRDAALRFDPATGEWRKLRPLPIPVRGLAAASIGNRRILLAGGYTASASEAAVNGPQYGFSSQVWIYDIGQDRYEPAAPLPFAASGIEITVHEGAIFGLGGEDRMRGRSRRMILGTME